MAMAYDSTHDENDTESIGAGSLTSTTSKSRVVLECPECGKELQSRSMFNHIKNLHSEYFKTMYKVWKADELESLIKEAKPFPVEWEYNNDFDETVFVNIWGCLACNSSFTSEETATTHCKKAKCKKEHIKALKAIKKEEEKELAQRNKKVADKRSRWLNRTAEQVFDDTRTLYEYYKNKLMTTLPTQFADYMVKLNDPLWHRGRFDFGGSWDIKLSSNKDEMITQENVLEMKIRGVMDVYLNALKELYNAPTIISDDMYTTLERAVKWTNDFPKLSFD